MSRSMTAGSYGKSLFSFVKKHRTASESDCAVLHSHQQRWAFLLPRILSSIWCCQWQGFSRHSWCATVLRCSDLQFPDSMRVEHLYMCLTAFCVSFLVRCLFRPSAHFLIGEGFSLCIKLCRCGRGLLLCFCFVSFWFLHFKGLAAFSSGIQIMSVLCLIFVCLKVIGASL